MGQVRRFWQAALAASFMLPVQQAAAADVWAVGGPGEEQGLRLRGPILSGDDKHFATAIEQIEATSSRVTAVALDSPGGVLGAAAAIAGQIHAHGITTVVENGAICASACVLLFAAGQARVAGPTAMIGVHGAADEHGTQTAPALVATAAIAQRYAEYGVPLSVIRRMATTQPGVIAWLTAAEVEEFPNTVISATHGDDFISAASGLPPRPQAAPADAQDDWVAGFRYGVAHPESGCVLDTRAVRDVQLATTGCEAGERSVRAVSGSDPTPALPHVFRGPHGE